MNQEGEWKAEVMELIERMEPAEIVKFINVGKFMCGAGTRKERFLGFVEYVKFRGIRRALARLVNKSGRTMNHKEKADKR